MLRFNSTTVQLIHKGTEASQRQQQMFQFHNGTINTIKNAEREINKKPVSIPQRYN